MRRPLSPHLGIYRLQITSGLSALHRITGITLTILLTALFAYIGLAFVNPSLFNEGQRYLYGWPWKCLWVVYCILLTYHMTNGVRHMVWDIGSGYDLKSVTSTGKIVLYVTGVVALASVLYIFHFLRPWS